jgi:hypothetical protein
MGQVDIAIDNRSHLSSCTSMHSDRPRSSREEPRCHQQMRKQRGRTGAPAEPGPRRTRNAKRGGHSSEYKSQTDEDEHAFPRLVIGELESLR